MRARAERWLNRRWYGDVAPGLGLRSLAGIYRVLSEARQPVVATRLPAPVLVIGNFTAGGTGKTPLVIAVAKYFSGRGYKPAVVSRGHGRQSSEPIRVSASTSVALCGDEPKLIAEKTGLPVLVDRNRVAAARAALQLGCNLIIADDGLQHRRLGRDLDIEVVDGERGYGNGLLLPAGPLRERPWACDFRVVNGAAGGPDEWAMRLRMTDVIGLDDTSSGGPLSGFAGASVNAVAAIGNPSRFFRALRAAGLTIIEHAFEDHHRFVAADFAGMTGPILMTEKDAVKCRGLDLDQAWAVPVEAELDPAFFAAIEQKLKEKHAGA